MIFSQLFSSFRGTKIPLSPRALPQLHRSVAAIFPIHRLERADHIVGIQKGHKPVAARLFGALVPQHSGHSKRFELVLKSALE